MSPSFGTGGGGIASQSRVVKSPPRQTRSTPITATACVEMVDHAVDRPSLGPDRDGVRASGRGVRRVGERAQLAVVEVRGVSWTARHAPWEQNSGAPAARSRISAYAPRDALGKIEDHAEPDEPVDELATEPRRARRPPRLAVCERDCDGSMSGPPCGRRGPGRSRPASVSYAEAARRPRARGGGRSARRDSTTSRSAAVVTCTTRSAFSAHGPEQARRLSSASRSAPSGWRSSSTKTGHTWSPTPPASSSGSHVRANAPRSPKRSSR